MAADRAGCWAGYALRNEPPRSPLPGTACEAALPSRRQAEILRGRIEKQYIYFGDATWQGKGSLAQLAAYTTSTFQIKLMKQSIIFFALFAWLCGPSETLKAQSGSGYHVVSTFHIASPGGWDYPAVHQKSNKLYLSHATQVNILNKETGDSINFIPNTTGVHGIAFADAFGKGYTSN